MNLKYILKPLFFLIPNRRLRIKLYNKFRLFLCKKKPIENKWIIFYDTFSKNGNGDSIKPIAQMLKKLAPNDFKFFFVSKKKCNIDIADEVLVENTFRMEEIEERAKYVVSSMNLPRIKRKGQVFIMTWHGMPLRKIYLDIADTKSVRFYVEQFKNVDYFCSKCEKNTDILSKAFDIKKDIFIKSGLPRNDALFYKEESFMNEIKNKLGIDKTKKVLLYCPTWRNSNKKMELALDLSLLKECIAENYVILIRSHVGKHTWVGDKTKYINDNFCIDVGKIEDITDLYRICDVLITDYSSVIFDFAITEKPMVFYSYDLDQYSANIGFYLDYETDLPGPIVKNTKELIMTLDEKVLNSVELKVKRQIFKKKFCSYENGTSTKQIIDLILKNDKIQNRFLGTEKHLL